MCGIVGTINLFNDFQKNREAVKSALDSMIHRGPDSFGIRMLNSNPLIVFGHVRLSIIDLSPESNQPMVDEDNGNVIIFNGEIYNFISLKEELMLTGIRFRTNSDTEVILKAYSKWGVNICNRLRGIFAFAIWDNLNRQLFLARDPIGVKPLYYFKSKDKFLFSSEVRALLQYDLVPHKLDVAGLNSFLAYGSVQEPLTLVKGVRSLPPGYYAFYDNNNCFEMKRYWHPYSGRTKYKPPEADFMVNELLKESVKLQLVSDVPLGIFLSGGIDSSSIVSLVRQVKEGPVKTFSIIFDDPLFDESKYARMVAKENGTDHAELLLTSQIVKDNLSRALDNYDQPSLDGLNTWFISKLVKEAGVTVALSGVGGDELFIGYDRFRKAMIMQKLQPVLSAFPSFSGNKVLNYINSEKSRRFSDLIGFNHPGYFLTRKLLSSFQSTGLIGSLYQNDQEWFEECFGEIISDSNNFTDKLTCISWFELRTYMLSTLLRDTDQMSMAHSLEVRVPLVDQLLVQMMLSLSDDVKKSSSVPKPLLVKAAGKGLPSECIYRKKQGFTFPFDKYFAEALGSEILDFFQSDNHIVFEKDNLYSLWSDYKRGSVSWSRIWTVFILERWLSLNHINS